MKSFLLIIFSIIFSTISYTQNTEIVEKNKLNAHPVIANKYGYENILIMDSVDYDKLNYYHTQSFKIYTFNPANINYRNFDVEQYEYLRNKISSIFLYFSDGSYIELYSKNKLKYNYKDIEKIKKKLNNY